MRGNIISLCRRGDDLFYRRCPGAKFIIARKKKRENKTLYEYGCGENWPHHEKETVSRCDDGDGFHFVETLFVKRRSTTSEFSHFFQRTKTGASTKLLRRQAQREKHRCELLNHRENKTFPKNPFSVNQAVTHSSLGKREGEKKKKVARHIFPKGHRLSEPTGAAQQLSSVTPKSKVLQIPSSLTTPSEEQFFGAIMTSIPPLIAVEDMLIINQLSTKNVIKNSFRLLKTPVYDSIKFRITH